MLSVEESGGYMNNNICQFYIVIGDKDFVSPDNVNVYINATDVTDMKVIQDEIFRLYKEKAKTGVSVGSEIIFLVGSISDSNKANEIIKRLRLNGKIEVMNKVEVKEEIKEEEKKEVSNDTLNTDKLEELAVIDKEELEVEDDLTDIKPANVYKKELDSNYSGYIGKPIEKKDKFGKLPIIFFIISLILFIVSVVMLIVFN